ncbi:ATP-binding protein [Pedobacter sp. PWIIR3]
MTNTDLTNCDVEPIRIPGKIQSYGFMVAVDKAHKIIYCSENISLFLGSTATELLAKPISKLDDILSDKSSSVYLSTLLSLYISQSNADAESQYNILVNDQPFTLLISKTADLFVLEFEPEMDESNANTSAILGVALSEMLAEDNLSKLLLRSAIQIKKVIAYDRVMIYKFHQDGHGEVVAEAKEEDLESWMGLHYPASDIPKQARELYKINLTRQIADVYSEPSSIAGLKENEASSFDMTHISMRAVSPIHIQYLKNMGVASSFSISLLYHGELWGLIACHSYSTRFISYKARNSAKLIGQVFSSALSYRQLQEDQKKTNKYKSLIDIIGVNLLNATDIPDALFDEQVFLLEAVEASGAILYYDQRLYSLGSVPDEPFCMQLIDWITSHTRDGYYETNCLTRDFPAAEPHKKLVSGILACIFSHELKEVLIWFRPEVLSTMTWAGDPTKVATIGADGLSTIHPRTSFANWTQDISNCSIQWKNEEVQAAKLVGEKVVSAISRKANELRLLNNRLKEAYDELDAFSLTLSHDLKNPLTSIKSYAQLLERNNAINDSGKLMVSRIMSSAEKMHFMIGDILSYSRAGQQRAVYEQVNMKELIQEINQELLGSNQGIIQVKSCHDIYGDKTMIMQVFSNLIGNAVKYSKKADQPHVEISSIETADAVQYTITDNGIGVHPDEHGKIFELFSRSSNVHDFEGTGVGLSIVKKIVERHRGKIWLESDGISGSSFYVSFLKPGLLKEAKINPNTNI